MSNYRNRPPDRSSAVSVSKDDIQKIIALGDAEHLVKTAEALGSSLGRELGNSQVRAIFGAVRRIEMTWNRNNAEAARDARRQLTLLKPKLRYRTVKKERLEPLTQALIDAIDAVNAGSNDADAQQRFHYFVEFFEAILAYHTVATA